MVVTVKDLKEQIVKKNEQISKLTDGVLDVKAIAFYKSLHEGMSDPERKRNKLIDVEINVENKKTIKVSEVLKRVVDMKPSNTKEQVSKLEAEIQEIKDKIVEMV